MNLKRTIAITHKVLRGLRHDKRTVGFLLLMPIFMIAIFGYTFGGEVKGVDIYIVNLDQGSGSGSMAEHIIAILQEDDALDVIEVLTSGSGYDDPAAYARDQVSAGNAWGAILFPVNFTFDVMNHLVSPPAEATPAIMTLMLDGSNLNIAQSIQSSAQSAVSLVLLQDLGFVPPIQVTLDMVYGEGMEFIDTFAPGVVSLAVMMVTFMLSIISFIHERTTGTLDRLLSTPVTEGEIVAGYALAFGAVGLIQSTVVLLTAILLFGVVIEGSVLLTLLIVFLLGVGMQGLGFLLSANARNEFQAIQFIPLILFPSILLSGVFWPLQSVPEVLRPVSYFLPLTYAVDGAKSVMIRGWGVDAVGVDIIILLAFAILMLLGSVLLMRRRR